MSKIVLEPIMEMDQVTLESNITENARTATDSVQLWDDFVSSDISLINTVYWEDL